MLRLETATVADFAPHVGTAFALSEENGDVPLTLTEAAPRGRNDGKNESGRPFALLFTGPSQPPLPQRIYALSHSEIGVLEIFIVPVSDDGVQRVYEAIFA